MQTFKANKINTDLDILLDEIKKIRKAKKLSLEDVSLKIGINIKYVRAIEKGDFEILPDGVYRENFIKRYCQFLGFEYTDIVGIINKKNNSEKKQIKKSLFLVQVAKNRHFITIPKVIKNAVIISAVVFCFSYLGYNISNIISPPMLELDYPVKNLTTKNYKVEIKGKTDEEADLKINGELVLSEKGGKFSKIVSLKEGINTVTIIAKKNYSRENVVYRQILVKNN